MCTQLSLLQISQLSTYILHTFQTILTSWNQTQPDKDTSRHQAGYYMSKLTFMLRVSARHLAGKGSAPKVAEVCERGAVWSNGITPSHVRK